MAATRRFWLLLSIAVLSLAGCESKSDSDTTIPTYQEEAGPQDAQPEASGEPGVQVEVGDAVDVEVGDHVDVQTPLGDVEVDVHPEASDETPAPSQP